MDCVGMSSAHEVLVAAHCGMQVVAMSIITNKVALDYASASKADHGEIVDVARSKSPDIEALVSLFFKNIAHHFVGHRVIPTTAHQDNL